MSGDISGQQQYGECCYSSGGTGYVVGSTTPCPVCNDDITIHPTHTCRQCYNAMEKCILAKTIIHGIHTVTLFEWEPHSNNCTVSYKIGWYLIKMEITIRHLYRRFAVTSLQLRGGGDLQNGPQRVVSHRAPQLTTC